MKISIITVVLNNSSYIEDCIISVLDQTFKDIEYIIIDGGSTDGTIDIIKKYEKKISKWMSEPDNGTYDAMNKGIKHAKGDIIGFLNADDIYYNDDVLERVVSVLEDSRIDACYADLVYVDKQDTEQVIRYWHSQQFKPGLFKKGWVPPHPTFFVKKKIYDHCGGFDLKYKLAADFELMARFLEYYKINVYYVPEIFVKMRLGGVTNKSIFNIIKQNFEIIDACKKNNIEVFIPMFLINKFFSKIKQFYLKKTL